MKSTRSTLFHHHRLVWLTLWITSAAGCGPAGPELVQVGGQVTMEGRPVAELIVTFTPVGNTPGNGSLGATDSSGKFTLTDVRGSPGAYAGEYRISFYPAPTKSDSDLPTDVVSSGAVGIPAARLNPNQTPLRAAVPARGGDVTIHLTRAGEGSTVEVQEPSSGR